eukprot:scaffold240353_cov27-Tisochrysis_lutea.AAC.4
MNDPEHAAAPRRKVGPRTAEVTRVAVREYRGVHGQPALPWRGVGARASWRRGALIGERACRASRGAPPTCPRRRGCRTSRNGSG